MYCFSYEGNIQFWNVWIAEMRNIWTYAAYLSAFTSSLYYLAFAYLIVNHRAKAVYICFLKCHYLLSAAFSVTVFFIVIFLSCHWHEHAWFNHFPFFFIFSNYFIVPNNQPYIPSPILPLSPASGNHYSNLYLHEFNFFKLHI